MAIAELGKKFPVRTEGVKVPLDDQVSELQAGDVMEQVLEVEGTLNRQATRELIHQILFMKKDYPQFVLHYLKVESSRITVQFAVAPPGAIISGAGGTISGDSDETRIAGGVAVPAIYIIAALVLAIIVAAILLTCAIKEIWVFRPKPKTGHAEVVALDQQSGLPIPNVNITVAGQTKKTGSAGQAAFFKDLVIGQYTVIGADVPNYQPPETVSVTVVWETVASCTLWYKPVDYVEPTHGWLSIATAGALGDIYIQAQIVGEPGYAYLHVEKGVYDVFFGPVKGYIHPPMVSLRVVGGWPTSHVAYYTLPPSAWWEKYAKYAIIGGGAIIGAAVLIPQIANIAARPPIPPKGGTT